MFIDRQIDNLGRHRVLLDNDWQSVGHHALLDFYVKIMPRVTRAERCSIFIHDPINEKVWLRAGTAVKEREIELSMDTDSIVGEVIASGKPQIARDMDKTEGQHTQTDLATGFTTREILCIPIKSLDGEEVTGAVQILNKEGGGHFDENDQAILEEMAHFLELALENIYFHEEATTALWDASKVISKLVTIGASGILVLGLAVALFAALWLKV